MSSEDLEHLYGNVYFSVYNKGAVGIASGLAHKSLESPFKADSFFSDVLELGAGMGQHRHFVRHGFDRYIESDLRPGPLFTGERDARVEKRVLDATHLPGIDDNSFDRIIATCLLTHLPDPEAALREWKRVLKPHGVLSIYLPADPGILLRLAQILTTARKTSKRGLNYWSLHLREHRHQFPYLALIVREVFETETIRIRSFPVPRMPWNLSLWFTAQVTKD